MTNIPATTATAAEKLERVLILGDISQLSTEERVSYYNRVCESVGLNPLTRPFEYMRLQGKEVLYAKRDATDQLRKVHSVSVTISGREKLGDIYVVTARASLPSGRVDESTGAVSIGRLSGDALANAYMKAETKAKRRVTLSICGLGLLDETEVETISQAKPALAAKSPAEKSENSAGNERPVASSQPPKTPAEAFTGARPVASATPEADAILGAESPRPKLNPGAKPIPEEIEAVDVQGYDTLKQAKAMRKAAYATAVEHGWSDERMRLWLAEEFQGRASLKLITKDELEKAWERFRHSPPPVGARKPSGPEFSHQNGGVPEGS